MMTAVHTLARFEQAKEQFKRQMCLNVDTLFNIFVSELNSNAQFTTSSNSIPINDARCFSGTDQQAWMRSTDHLHHNVPDNERAPDANLNSAEQTLYENDSNLSDKTRQNNQNTIQTTDQLVQSNNLPQQQHSQSALFYIKQEIMDEDEQLGRSQYYNNANDDTNWEEFSHDGRLIDENVQESVRGCQCDTCQSGITNHDEEIYDEELLREVKQEILQEELSNAKKQKNDTSKCAQIDAAQVDISTEDQSTENVDRLINSNSTCTTTQASTSHISNDSSVQSNYEQNEITNSQTEQNTESKVLENRELLDSNKDEHLTEFAVKQTIDNNNSHDKECNNEENLISSVRESSVPDKSNTSSLSPNHNFPTFDYDKFRVITQKCSSCNLPFGTTESLTGHMFKVHNLLPFQCPFSICTTYERSFASINILTEHFQHNHGHSQMICSECDQKCASPMALFTHAIYYHRHGEFACVKDNCDHVARFRVLAIEHYNRKHLLNDNKILTKHLTESNISEKPNNDKRKSHDRKSQKKIKNSLTSSGKEDTIQSDKSNIIPKLDCDKFRVINLRCPSCKLLFETDERLADHMLQVHSQLPFQCPFPVCSAARLSFLTRNKLEEHFQYKKHNRSRIICSECDKKCTSPMALFTHTIDHHRYGLFACVKNNCDHVARSRELAIEHYKREHLDKDNKAPIHSGLRSPKRKRSRVDEQDDLVLRKAQFRVLSEKCTVKGCNSEYSKASELGNHLKRKHGISYNVCPIERCSNRFTLRSELIRHSEVSHPDKHQFKCDTCGFLYPSFVLLDKHNFMNHQEGKFKCGRCDYVSAFRSEVIRHYTYIHIYKEMNGGIFDCISTKCE